MSDFQSRLQSALGHEFLIERELGGGGMSRVFVATEKALQRRVVIKVLPPELAAGVNIERFRREIQLAAGLQHPHIVPLLAAGDDDGLLWFSMPFIEGESLRSALTKRGRLPARDVVRILHDVVDALAYAHARGIVHRDIKPDNVLASGLHALVTDFGVAKALSAAVPLPGGTTTGMAIGTPAYMAPEQLAADPAADHRVDLYAVGLLAYELLTGKSPFSGISPQATLAAQLTKMPEPPHLSFADVPEALSAIILHCLEKDAAKRPASASVLLAELEALPPMSSGQSVPLARRRRLSKRVLAAAGAVVVVIAALAAQQERFPDGPRADGARDTPAARGAQRDGRSAARDAGGGGSRAPGMSAAPGAATRPETVIVVYRDPASLDGTQGVQVPVVISRAESLAIAEAMRKRMESAPTAVPEPSVTPRPPAATVGGGGGGQQGMQGTQGAQGTQATPGVQAAGSATAAAGGSVSVGPGVAFRGVNPRVAQQMHIRRPDGTFEVTINGEDILSEVRRVFSDSMKIAMRSMDSVFKGMPRVVRMDAPRPSMLHSVYPLVGPNADGRIRLVVANFTDVTRRGDMKGIGHDVAQFLRASLPADRFEVMDDQLTEKAWKIAPDRMAMGWALRSDYVVSGVVRVRNDSLSLLTVFTDVRAGRNSGAEETVVPLSEPKRAFEIALGHVTGWLERAKTRRVPAPPAPPVPVARDRGSERGPERP